MELNLATNLGWLQQAHTLAHVRFAKDYIWYFPYLPTGVTMMLHRVFETCTEECQVLKNP